MIINVLMPTYNDEKTIIEAIESILIQSYQNWHLYVINDGSTDNTEKVIKKFIKEGKLDSKITYIYEKNSDQLNAIKNGLDKIPKNDGLIYVLHSDDILANENVFENAVKYFNSNPSVEAIIADYYIMNEKSEIIGYKKVKKYDNSFQSIALLGLWLGRNQYVDVAFWKYKTYIDEVNYNYLTWNMPFWLCHKDKLKILNVKNVNFPFFCYRVFEENYINNEVGLLNVLNGEIRTILTVLSELNIPFYKIQYYIFRIFNKLGLGYKVFFIKRKTKNVYKILYFVIKKRINMDDISKYPYLDSLLGFFKNSNNRTITIDFVNNDDIYFGSDLRKFNTKMLNNTLPSAYYRIFKELKQGFKYVKVSDKNKCEVECMLKFLGINDYIKIIKK